MTTTGKVPNLWNNLSCCWMHAMVWVHSINLRGSDSDSHTWPSSVLESSSRQSSLGNTRSICYATSQWATESTSNCVDGGWCPFHKYIEQKYSQIISNRPSELVFSLHCVSARTANNPIEKLVGSPVLSSPLMNNSAVRVKAGRGDLVTDDWLSTLWPEGDTKPENCILYPSQYVAVLQYVFCVGGHMIFLMKRKYRGEQDALLVMNLLIIWVSKSCDI